MGTNPRTVHTGLNPHCSKFKSTNKWRRSSTCMNLGNTLQWKCYPWKSILPLKIPQNFLHAHAKIVPKTSFRPWKPCFFSASFARQSLEMHKTSTFCIILRVDFGRKHSNVSFYRFNFEKFCVSFFNVSFYRVIILVVHFWKKNRLRRVSFYWVIILPGQLVEIFATQMYHFTGWSFYRVRTVLNTPLFRESIWFWILISGGRLGSCSIKR